MASVFAFLEFAFAMMGDDDPVGRENVNRVNDPFVDQGASVRRQTSGRPVNCEL